MPSCVENTAGQPTGKWEVPSVVWNNAGRYGDDGKRRGFRDFLRSRMPWAQEALERPCAWVALDKVRFILRDRARTQSDW